MSIPEIGQIVEVRQRPWVVADVAVSAFTPDPLRGVSGQQPLVTLSSIEDDGLGEELQVLWEIEPSRSIREQSGLPAPTGFDDPTALDCFLDAVRWGSVSSADLKALQAPFRSGIAIEDYQLDPVVRALSMPRVNLLIADDVGLGKTIETGLVIQELLLRHRARSVLVISPSALQVRRKRTRDGQYQSPLRRSGAETVSRGGDLPGAGASGLIPRHLDRAPMDAPRHNCPRTITIAPCISSSDCPSSMPGWTVSATARHGFASCAGWRRPNADSSAISPPLGRESLRCASSSVPVGACTTFTRERS